MPISITLTTFISKTYNLIEDKYWLLVKDYAIGDFNLIENNDKVVGFLAGRRPPTIII